MSAAEMPAGAAPEPTPDWHSIDWRKVWRTVRRLQVRIVKAVTRHVAIGNLPFGVRSDVGTVPGGMVGLATDPDADRLQSDSHWQIHVQQGRTETAASRKGR